MRYHDRSGSRCKLEPGDTVRPNLAYYSYVVEIDIPVITSMMQYGSLPYPNYINNLELRRLVSGNNISTSGVPSGTYAVAAYSKAYDDLMEQILGDSSSLGVSVAEGREAIASIVDRVTRMTSAWKALKRGRFDLFLRHLGGRPKEKHKHTKWTRPKDAASLWLEYWLGWAPLVGDIHNCTRVLASADLVPPVRLSARGSVRFPTTVEVTTNYRQKIGLGKGRCTIGIGCTVEVINPNKYLSARMGLDAPLEIAWAVVPFSFVIDWFANIGQVLGSMDFRDMGIKISDPWVSCNSTATGSCNWETGTAKYQSLTQFSNDYVHARWSRRVLVNKIPTPRLSVRIPERLSTTRGATAISLLVSLFTKG